MSEERTAAAGFTIGIARALAQAHADAGLAEFNQLQQVAVESKRNPTPGDYLRHLCHAVPAVTCLSLAAEQFLKVIHCQYKGTYPRGHDLVQLFQGLPADCQDAMRATYLVKYSESVALEVVHFGLVAGTDKASIPDVAAPEFPTLDGALKHLRGAFRSWRYIYERMEPAHQLGIHFKSLLMTIESARVQVVSHSGNASVTFGRTLE